MPGDDRGRTHSASCATCRWWGGFGDGWGECVRPDERCADPACETVVPPTLMRVVAHQGLACGDGCCEAFLHTEAGFGCRAWEPLDSGPQDAPETAQGEAPGRGLPSRGGPFPASRAGVLDGVGDDSLSRRDRDLLKADFAAALRPEAAERLADDLRAAADRARAGDGEAADAGA